MEEFQEKKLEFLKWEKEHLETMIKAHIISHPEEIIYDSSKSTIERDNRTEIHFLIKKNESLLSMYYDCKSNFPNNIIYTIQEKNI